MNYVIRRDYAQQQVTRQKDVTPAKKEQPKPATPKKTKASTEKAKDE